jgi:hypothetical protein
LFGVGLAISDLTSVYYFSKGFTAILFWTETGLTDSDFTSDSFFSKGLTAILF